MVHGVYENERVFTNNGKDIQRLQFLCFEKSMSRHELPDNVIA